MNDPVGAPNLDERFTRVAALENRIVEMMARDSSQRRVFELMPVSTLVFDTAGMIIDANLSAARLFGLDLKFLPGKPLVASLDAGCHVEFWRHRQHVMAAAGATTCCDLVLRRRSGDLIPLRFESVLIVDRIGHHRIVATLTDLSERRRAESALLTARVAAEESVRARSNFLDNMSHELRTPLNGVIGLLDLLIGEMEQPEQIEIATLALQSARNLTGLISGILDLSRLESGRMELDPAPFQPRKLIEEALATVIATAAKKQLQVALIVRSEVPLLLDGDAMRIRQIIINLLGNAVKFTNQGFVSITLSSEYDQHVRHILVAEIRDSGPGIPANRLVRIFERFEQGDPSLTRTNGGSGLGLAIVRQMAQLMHGSVGVESELGFGSCFTVRMRLPELSPAPIIPIADDEPWMILEDRELTRRALVSSLADLGKPSGFVALPLDPSATPPTPLLARAELLPPAWTQVPGIYVYASHPTATQLLAPILPSRLARLITDHNRRQEELGHNHE